MNIEEEYKKDISIQRYVNLIGNYIVNDNISKDKSVTKSFGEVEIKNVRYQIQVTLVPNKNNWNSENGITTHKSKSSSWIKRKILSLFTFIMDAEAQK